MNTATQIRRKSTIVMAAVLAWALCAGPAAANCEPSASGHGSPQIKLKSSAFESSPGGPKIGIIQVAHSEGASNPAAIGIRIRPGVDAAINYDSLRFHYGMFRIDITDQIKQCFDITQDILVSGAMLPSGTHKLIVKVADIRDKKAQFTVKIQVL